MKILIVEDEIGIQNFLKQGLEEEGFEITTASNGTMGLATFKNESFDLVLLDWMLPGITGIEVCKQIRIINKVIPILFLTARDTVQDTIEGLKMGANDYIKKPFSFEELLERIKIHFRNSNENKELTLGDIRLNSERFEVFVNDTEIALTHREFELLEYLMKNKGKACSRKNIIEDVWDIHFEYDTGVIDVFMNALRKKLSTSKGIEQIKTVRGVGYIAND